MQTRQCRNSPVAQDPSPGTLHSLSSKRRLSTLPPPRRSLTGSGALGLNTCPDLYFQSPSPTRVATSRNGKPRTSAGITRDGGSGPEKTKGGPTKEMGTRSSLSRHGRSTSGGTRTSDLGRTGGFQYPTGSHPCGLGEWGTGGGYRPECHRVSAPLGRILVTWSVGKSGHFRSPDPPGPYRGCVQVGRDVS